MPYTCPVCGYPGLYDPPRSESGNGSYEICPSCGFEFGVSDDDKGETYEGWRARWIAEGKRWQSKGRPQPAGWDPGAQLRTLGGERGQTAAEYLGLLLVVSVIVAAVATSAIGRTITGKLSREVACIAVACDARAATSPPPGDTPSGPGKPDLPYPGAAVPGTVLPGQVDEAQQANEEAPDYGWGRPDTLQDHFDRHGPDFNSQSPEDYARQAQEFFKRGVDERLPTKVDTDGTIRIYDPDTNEFGAYNADGTTRTYFKPDDGIDYWNKQKGTDPYASEGDDQPQGNPGDDPPAANPEEPEMPEEPEVPEMPEMPEMPELPELPIIIP